ncbi:hypothetical protein BH24ACT19_BH24ACT19_19020 [soil metagenome]
MSRLKETLGRFYVRVRGSYGGVEPVGTPELESRAELVIREYLGLHAGMVERATRLGKKAERLERDGIPSESARNRAERARGEVVAGLAAPQTSFVEAGGGWEGANAVFDRVVEFLCPAFAPRRPSGGLEEGSPDASSRSVGTR